MTLATPNASSTNWHRDPEDTVVDVLGPTWPKSVEDREAWRHWAASCFRATLAACRCTRGFPGDDAGIARADVAVRCAVRGFPHGADNTGSCTPITSAGSAHGRRGGAVSGAGPGARRGGAVGATMRLSNSVLRVWLPPQSPLQVVRCCPRFGDVHFVPSRGGWPIPRLGAISAPAAGICMA